MRGAHEAWMARRSIRRVACFGSQPNKGGNGGMCLALQLGYNRSQRWPSTRRIYGTARRPAGVADEGIVVASQGAVKAADGHELIHHRGDARRVLGDLDAGHLGLDRFIGAADFQWSI